VNVSQAQLPEQAMVSSFAGAVTVGIFDLVFSGLGM